MPPTGELPTTEILPIAPFLKRTERAELISKLNKAQCIELYEWHQSQKKDLKRQKMSSDKQIATAVAKQLEKMAIEEKAKARPR